MQLFRTLSSFEDIIYVLASSSTSHEYYVYKSYIPFLGDKATPWTLFVDMSGTRAWKTMVNGILVELCQVNKPTHTAVGYKFVATHWELKVPFLASHHKKVFVRWSFIFMI